MPFCSGFCPANWVAVTSDIIELQFQEAKATRLEQDIFSEQANVKLHPVCKDQSASYIPVKASDCFWTSQTENRKLLAQISLIKNVS